MRRTVLQPALLCWELSVACYLYSAGWGTCYEGAALWAMWPPGSCNARVRLREPDTASCARHRRYYMEQGRIDLDMAVAGEHTSCATVTTLYMPLCAWVAHHMLRWRWRLVRRIVSH